MTARKRLSADERKRAILETAVPLFAAKGFEAVTTRELADACGVTEPVLYRHFPSKAALYREIQRQVDSAEDHAAALRSFEAMPASTEKLVLGLHMLITHLVLDIDEEHKVFPRLMLRSLLDNGAFARTNLSDVDARWFRMLADSLAAARNVGDADDVQAAPSLMVWMTHHLAFALKAMAIPAKPVVEYGVSRKQLAHQAVLFALRGMGVREAALARCLASVPSSRR